MYKEARICFIQLPLLDPNYSGIKANIPLAAGYLKSYAEEKKHSSIRRMEIIPRDLVNFGGDEVILNWIEANDFNVVAFTSFMWNIERSFFLAQKIKERDPHVFIIMGGPEITEGRNILQNQYIDTFICGEGEVLFYQAINDFVNGIKPLKVTIQTEPLDLSQVPNPYVKDVITPSGDEGMLLETMRGCVSKCSYCYYSKANSLLRYFPETMIKDFFEKARGLNASEIYIMDPSFSCRPDFKKFLSFLIENNHTKIPLHTELILESVDEETADLLKEASFVSVEAGLQSTNFRALQKVRRYFNEEKFLRGAALLQERGINIRTGLILGLPGDTLSDFADTLHFVEQNNLLNGLEIYPLSIIPGSPLSSELDEHGIKFISLPPYWVISNKTMKYEDFFEAKELLRNKLGLELFDSILPHFKDPAGEFTGFLDLRNADNIGKIFNLHNISNNLTILLNEVNLSDINALIRFAVIMKEANPFTLLQIVVDSELPISEKLSKTLSNIFFHGDNYIERNHLFDEEQQQKFSVRVFQLTNSIETVSFIEKKRLSCDPVLKYTPENMPNLRDFLVKKMPVVLVPCKISDSEINELKTIYKEMPELLIFQEI